ncbi:MAG: redoxin domain-containing protein [Armatimonadetes bacterium]|nr:redoxin domain-containing protein [Armatimonadota bacterium]
MKSPIYCGLCLLVVSMANFGCLPKPDPSMDPKSAVLDPSKVHPVTSSMTSNADVKKGLDVSGWELTDTKGAKKALKNFLGGKPGFIYFIQRDCPCCVDARPFISQIIDAANGSIITLGLINGSVQEAEKWQHVNEFKADTMLIDPKEEATKAFKVETGVALVILNAEGVIDRIYPGYCQTWLDQAKADLERLTQSKFAKTDFSQAPKEPTSGCYYEWASQGSTAPKRSD